MDCMLSTVGTADTQPALHAHWIVLQWVYSAQYTALYVHCTLSWVWYHILSISMQVSDLVLVWIFHRWMHWLTESVRADAIMLMGCIGHLIEGVREGCHVWSLVYIRAVFSNQVPAYHYPLDTRLGWDLPQTLWNWHVAGCFYVFSRLSHVFSHL